MGGVERFLLDNGFELETYYRTNKYYCKQITDLQFLYVRIYSNVNKIVEVVYKQVADSKFDTTREIPFETITTLEKLELLLISLS